MRKQIKQILTWKLNKEYNRRKTDKQTSYERWLHKQDLMAHLTGTIRSRSRGHENYPEIRLFKWKECRLSDNALYEIGCYFIDHLEVEIAYGDEDSKTWQGRSMPWFKPEWSPDTFRSCFYFGGVAAVRFTLLKDYEDFLADLSSPGEEWTTLPVFPDNMTVVEYSDKNAYMKVICSLICFIQNREDKHFDGRECNTIKRIPRILSHRAYEPVGPDYMEWKNPLSHSPDSLSAEEEIRKAYNQVSVVIPSKDNPQILKKALSSLFQFGTPFIREVFIIDNGSSEDNKAKLKEIIGDFNKELNLNASAEAFDIITYVFKPMDFNFSQMCNEGAKLTTGEFLLFMNDDVELCCRGFLQKMTSYAGQGHVGAVGLKLYYPETVIIQHAGITNLPMGPVHKLQFLDDNKCYYFGRNKIDSNVLAVTGACMLIRREIYGEAGGFSEELQIAFNDVDLCFTLYEKGYHNVVVNTAYAWHHESLSRGDDESSEKLERLMEEKNKLYRRHPDLKGYDPYYPEELNQDGLDTRIREQYVTEQNRPHPFKPKVWERKPGEYRQDPCLLLKIEECSEERILGYSIVLGDNNACYDKKLFFSKAPENDQNCFIQNIEEQYRPDLEENMPDQCNVALCGFQISLTNKEMLPTGRYRIGIIARNRITGLKLCNYSNHYLTSSSKAEVKNRSQVQQS